MTPPLLREGPFHECFSPEKMKYWFTLLVLVCCPLTAIHAQSFLDHLRQKVQGQGTITITENTAIDNLVNGKPQSNTYTPSTTGKPSSTETRRNTTTTGKNTTTPSYSSIPQTPKNPQKATTQSGQDKQKKLSKAERKKLEQQELQRAQEMARQQEIQRQQEQERQAALEKERQAALERERQATMERERQAAQQQIAEHERAERAAAERKAAAEKKAAAERKAAENDENFDIPTVDMRKKVMRGSHKVTGYRVQAFAGGNSRADRVKAEKIGNMIKMRFPDLPVYVHFYSPRWICRVGNFRSQSEAMRVLRQVRAMGCKGACLVKGKITVQY